MILSLGQTFNSFTVETCKCTVETNTIHSQLSAQWLPTSTIMKLLRFQSNNGRELKCWKQVNVPGSPLDMSLLQVARVTQQEPNLVSVLLSFTTDWIQGQAITCRICWIIVLIYCWFFTLEICGKWFHATQVWERKPNELIWVNNSFPTIRKYRKLLTMEHTGPYTAKLNWVNN